MRWLSLDTALVLLRYLSMRSHEVCNIFASKLCRIEELKRHCHSQFGFWNLFEKFPKFFSVLVEKMLQYYSKKYHDFASTFLISAQKLQDDKWRKTVDFSNLKIKLLYTASNTTLWPLFQRFTAPQTWSVSFRFWGLVVHTEHNQMIWCRRWIT